MTADTAIAVVVIVGLIAPGGGRETAEVLIPYLRETVRFTLPPSGSVVPGAGL